MHLTAATGKQRIVNSTLIVSILFLGIAEPLFVDNSLCSNYTIIFTIFLIPIMYTNPWYYCEIFQLLPNYVQTYDKHL
jgi:hypothetical protein